ncbi:MAG: helix-turn-helix domain-containing protein [Clostridiales bacterium]|nr:helix-turn-helix domain-containing protein [Clostridiales bacterium]
MNGNYYTVEQIAEMLHMHPKTIQRYIREGKLRAGKVGKGWRITGHDLSAFMESLQNGYGPEGVKRTIPQEDRVRVSSVVDIRVYDREEAIRIVNTLTAVLNTKPPQYGISSMHTQYIQDEGKVRVTLWGGIRFMEAIMGSIAVLTEPEEE